MLYFIIGLGLLFIGIGFIITENNAKYLLAGYNTLSKEKQAQIDIKPLLAYFRKFHLFLGISCIVLGLILTYVFNEVVGGAFIVIYPCLAYIYFVITSTKYSEGLNSKRKNTVAIFILVATLLFVVGLLGYGLKEHTISIAPDAVEIHGTYGEVLLPSEIARIELVHKLPKITFKSNGFAMGSVKKGYFKTEAGERVKLILNADNKPYLLFEKRDGKKIYYTAKSESSVKLLDSIRAIFPKASPSHKKQIYKETIGLIF